MRLRTFVGLVAMFTLAGSALTASSASAYQLMDPVGTVAPTAATDVVIAETTAEPCPPSASLVAAPLPKLGPGLAAGLAAYAKNPSGGDVDAWMDSGGSFGGGVPASAVRTLMRRGLAAGLTDEQVQGFLEPGFLRGMNDPYGGASLLKFIGDQNDPALLGALTSFAGALNGRVLSPMSAEAQAFAAFPILRAAYMSQAQAIPPDLVTAEQMLSLANQGYGPAQKTVQAFLAGGSTPSAGAQNAGGVADGMRAAVYDLFVSNYAGPLNPAATAAVANRREYNAWVERIATWADGGAPMDQVPDTAVFHALVASTTSSAPVVASPAAC